MARPERSAGLAAASHELRRRDRARFVRAPTRRRTLHALRPTIAQGLTDPKM
jgi:hypothetical protein